MGDKEVGPGRWREIEEGVTVGGGGGGGRVLLSLGRLGKRGVKEGGSRQVVEHRGKCVVGVGAWVRGCFLGGGWGGSRQVGVGKKKVLGRGFLRRGGKEGSPDR